MSRLAGKVCVVTGGASGIGRAICLAFASEGAAVLVTDRNGAGAEDTAHTIARAGGRAVAATADVTRLDDVDRIAQACMQDLGRVDVLVSNAGIGKLGLVTELSEADWDDVLAINLKGPFLCARRIIPEMIKQGGGAVINVASVAGIVASPGRPAYCASKAGLVMLTKAMALDHASQGVRVNAICPGVIVTPMTEPSLKDPATRKERLDKTPLGRLGTPADIAPAAVYLASDESLFVTGHALIVDGGWCAD